ncbi:hypothetical protein EMIHUDRAFT_451930 [Emiliania huxleyi CCMP1516]|uniref:TIR domain-containing protein n=3 Tax=Emiliania huxleyi TaxID=2903 RepID=A0A0D3IRI9_EMIH1|nr:hypothetical protein EMIHUDRAFT_451930 [Emiliania huxleyi CCMP1516]EOD13874.1 hypothetical protein EMIHUDRAFT_451930 [Emiliania huxleyi CCMP1516]|eukprot:XP_005766303.1 hypothetical protein EMIHUDRAFT_451930 [Emiliania huxleyi CCMP1516]
MIYNMRSSGVSAPTPFAAATTPTPSLRRLLETVEWTGFAPAPSSLEIWGAAVRAAPPAPPGEQNHDWKPQVGESCNDDCFYANNGVCNDGAAGSTDALCAWGSDCRDCGRREGAKPACDDQATAEGEEALCAYGSDWLATPRVTSPPPPWPSPPLLGHHRHATGTIIGGSTAAFLVCLGLTLCCFYCREAVGRAQRVRKSSRASQSGIEASGSWIEYMERTSLGGVATRAASNHSIIVDMSPSISASLERALASDRGEVANGSLNAARLSDDSSTVSAGNVAAAHRAMAAVAALGEAAAEADDLELGASAAGDRGSPSRGRPSFRTELYGSGEAAMEARFLQTELEALLGRKCFLDSDDLRDLRLLQQAVRESDCLILVQSKSVLFRPYCILEMVTAIEARVPIVGVSLSVAGIDMYNFNLAPAFLTHLERTLEQANPGASSVLTRANVDLTYAARLLGSTVPEIISISFNPSSSRNMLAASVADIAAAMEHAMPSRVPTPEEWERHAAVVSVPSLDWINDAQAQPPLSQPHTRAPSPTPTEVMRRTWLPPFKKTGGSTWAPANGRN